MLYDKLGNFSQQKKLCLDNSFIESQFNYAILILMFRRKTCYSKIEKMHPIECIGVSTPPQKHHPLFLAKSPLKSANCPSPSFLGNSCLYIGFL